MDVKQEKLAKLFTTYFFVVSLLIGFFVVSAQPLLAHEADEKIYPTLTMPQVAVGYVGVALLLTPLMFFLFFHKGLNRREKSEKIGPVDFSLICISVALFFIATCAIDWDIWWHVAIGRNSFWEPPHELFYGSLLLPGIIALARYLISRKAYWLRFGVGLLGLPVAAISDNIWHGILGSERIFEIWLTWSPPHVFLVTVFVLNLLLLMRGLKQAPQARGQQFFTTIAYAILTGALLFLSVPFEPVGQWQEPWRIIGFWGAGVITFVITSVFLRAQQNLKSVAPAFTVLAFFLVIHNMSVGQHVAPGIVTLPHDNPPLAITLLSYVFAVGAMDLLKRYSPIVRGAVYGLLYNLILYGSSSWFFKPEFQYSAIDANVAIVSGVIGGVFAGMFILLAFNKRQLRMRR